MNDLTPTDEELAAMGLPSRSEILDIFARNRLVGEILAAARWDVRNPNTPLVISELAEQILAAKPGTIPGYPDPRSLGMVEHDRRIAEQAWDEGASACGEYIISPLGTLRSGNPYAFPSSPERPTA